MPTLKKSRERKRDESQPSDTTQREEICERGEKSLHEFLDAILQVHQTGIDGKLRRFLNDRLDGVEDGGVGRDTQT